MINVKSSGYIRPNDLVNVKELHNELIIQKFIPRKKTMKRRLNKTQHIDYLTGLVTDDKVSTHRRQSQPNLRQSLKALKDIIKLNTTNLKKTLMLTLTYAQKEYCAHKAQYDFKMFFRRLRRRQKNLGAIEYISTREFHEDNSYHLHALLYFNQADKHIFINAADVSELWGHGDVDVQQPYSVEYACNYLTPHSGGSGSGSAKNKKMYIKASRLLNLPTGQKLYQCSSGIKRPKIEKKKYAEALEELEENEYEFERDFKYPSPIRNSDGYYVFHVREQYKKSVKRGEL